MIAVTFALPAESSDFIRLLEECFRENTDGLETCSGTLHAKRICVVHTGVGEKAAHGCMERFFGKHPEPELLISAGFAGGLSDTLQVGDLFIAQNFSSRRWIERARAAPITRAAQVGTLATAGVIADSASERQALAQATGAAAVDMESAIIAGACAQRAVPMISLRVITDTAASPLPAPPTVLFNLEKQRTDFLPLFAHLLKRPQSVGRLLRFATQISKARRHLARSLESLLRDPLP